MAEQVPLLPCPFCGGTAEVNEQHCDGVPSPPDGYQEPELWGWTCGCLECGIEFWAEEATGQSYAVARWNRRVVPAITRESLLESLGEPWDATLHTHPVWSEEDILDALRKLGIEVKE